MRRNGGSQVVLNPLGDSTNPFTGEAGVNAKIVEIIGLDFNAFCSSVSLPQGDFDRFLSASKSERSQILKGIFRLDRVDAMRQTAKARREAIDVQITGLGAVIRSTPADPEQERSRLGDIVATTKQRVEQIRELLPGIAAMEHELASLDERLAGVARSINSNDSALNALPGLSALEDLLEADEKARTRSEDSGAALKIAEQKEVGALSELAEARTTLGGPEWLTTAASAIKEVSRVSDRLNEIETKVPAIQANLSAAEVSVTTLTLKLQEVETLVERHREELHAVHAGNAANLLRHELALGKPCPVCLQVVASAPTSAASVAGKEAEAAKRLTGAERDVKGVRAELDAAGRQMAVAEERKVATDAEKAQRESELKALREHLTEVVGAGVDPAAEVERRRKVLQGLEVIAQRAAAQRLDGATESQAAAGALAQISKGSLSFAASLIKACVLIGIDEPSVEDDLSTLIGVAKRLQDAGREKISLLEAQSKGLQSAAEQSRTKIADFRSRFGAEPQETAADLLAKAKQSETSALRDLEDFDKRMLAAAAARDQFAELTTKRGWYERLSVDLTDSKFTDYLLDAQKRLLSQLGSEKLLELTGYYRFDDDGEFQIVDERTGKTRTSDTLSGGETFLASLSLALALAEAVALDGGVLGCFFLDEGFGSLDNESLELALEGIETLAVPGRLIGLISHVGGIQARLDDLIVLERGTDGRTIVVQHEGPLGFAASTI